MTEQSSPEPSEGDESSDLIDGASTVEDNNWRGQLEQALRCDSLRKRVIGDGLRALKNVTIPRNVAVWVCSLPLSDDGTVLLDAQTAPPSPEAASGGKTIDASRCPFGYQLLPTTVRTHECTDWLEIHEPRRDPHPGPDGEGGASWQGKVIPLKHDWVLRTKWVCVKAVN